MKKQLLIVLMLAFTAGCFNSAYGQVVPRPIECLTGDHLNPIAGQPYTYEISVPAPPSWNAVHYRWFVTQDINLIAASALTGNIAADGSFFNRLSGSGYNLAYPTPGGGTNLIELTWHSIGYDPALPILLGILVVGEDGLCTPNNLKVYRIEPQLAFTLDIANRNATNTATLSGYGVEYDEHCLPGVVSATYQATPEGILYNYGQNYMYFEVIAANWSLAWQLSIEFAGAQAGQDVTIEYSKDPTFAAGVVAMTGPAAYNGIWTTTELIQPTSGTVIGAAGETIYIRVLLEHNNWEGIPSQAYSLAVDGQLFYQTGTPLVWTAAGLFDLHFAAGATCGLEDEYDNDIAYQTLRTRPNVQEVTPAAPSFLPGL